MTLVFSKFFRVREKNYFSRHFNAVVRIRSDPMFLPAGIGTLSPEPDPTCNNGYILYLMPTIHENIFYLFRIKVGTGFFFTKPDPG